MTQSPADAFPEIPFAAWQDSCATLHLCSQVVGKYRLARTPWVNHSWHATLYPVPLGLTTGPVPDAGGSVEVLFDFQAERLRVFTADGRERSFALGATSLAGFQANLRTAVEGVGGTPEWHGAPNEVPDPTPFAKDTKERPWDAEAIGRFHRALLSIAAVFGHHRTSFLGKISPVHLFWGSFDLAVTRFSGRTAPLHPGGIPSLPDDITREAYSHEVASAGFWPGGGVHDDAAFYAYAYPTPEGFSSATIEVADAFWSEDGGEFVLPYESVRTAPDPAGRLLSFLDATYLAAARLGGWDREALECARGEPRVVRPLRGID